MSFLRTTGRATVLAEQGMVASAHPLATQAGIRVLREGGNAVDAAIAAAAVTWVTLPTDCGPGGEAFFLYFDARSRSLTAINGSGRVGTRATAEFLRSRGYGQVMPQEGALAASIPGCVHALETALTRWGSRGWDDLLAEAIVYAESHPVTRSVAADLVSSVPTLSRYPSSTRIFLPNGRPPAAGTLLRQPELAQTLRRLAAGGAREFYEGAVGAAIAAYADRNGLWGADELAAHRSEIYTPLSAPYRGYTIHQFRPPSQGFLLLEQMAILEQFDLAALPPAALHHLMLEAKKIAFADRNRLAGDPEHVDFDAGRLYAPEYARRRAAEIRTDAAGPVDGPGLPEGDTTYLCAVDREGNAVSLIHSIYSECGNGEVIDGLGFWLNNRAKAFRLVEGHPNCIAPLKRPMHTLNCFIVTQDGLPCYVGGTPGADGQPQWNMQVLVNLIDLGMGVQEAIEAPRWRHYPGTDPATLDETPVLTIEAGFPDEVYAALRARGHSLQVTGPFETTGKFQLIRIDRAQGVLHGGSDPRGDGMAAGI